MNLKRVNLGIINNNFCNPLHKFLQHGRVLYFNRCFGCSCYCPIDRYNEAAATAKTSAAKQLLMLQYDIVVDYTKKWKRP